jgi:hypothetical protein
MNPLVRLRPAGTVNRLNVKRPTFNIRFFKVSFSIKLAAFQASGGADT